ncbi:hypothetical protein PV11_09676 [Exophiala sideris]|uniref:Uncharacterized protein n=1 Tax=Exophiala sideris TaxID=1016849 RepID=A0A0D1VPB8_9EURO|nr:hypothetical protein PV11_09676 [Exophiala sideris]
MSCLSDRLTFDILTASYITSNLRQPTPHAPECGLFLFDVVPTLLKYLHPRLTCTNSRYPKPLGPFFAEECWFQAPAVGIDLCRLPNFCILFLSQAHDEPHA